MLSAPKHLAAAFSIAVILYAIDCSPSQCQAPARLVSSELDAHDSRPTAVDPADQELLELGRVGETIQRVRVEVIALLSEETACSAWFRSAEPDAAAKFRSLRYVLDSSGPAEIVTSRDSQDSSLAIHPYVARAAQNVGWGSTITLNANGAFFRQVAYVRTLPSPSDFIGGKSFRPLFVGDFSGATPAARIFSLLHEFGHVVDMLPIDAGSPGSPLVSVENTSAVLAHCGSQIRAHAKHLQKHKDSPALRASSLAAANVHFSHPDSSSKWERPFLGGRRLDM